ncbi:MAG TPA: NADH-quinone oxidoreductase subunit NuoG [Thermoleophilaceae bacterium]|nr:NADH-quinone oxidoreductase subunit NuoG [Thermoleophilaceae bacterium]
MTRPDVREITFEIDGREVLAPEGQMLVDAAKHGDVEIPYFCYEPKLGQPVGACRMCLVEIEGIPKLQTSCSTPVKDGMVVNTTSERVKAAQNAVVEFLLINHPLDCPVCDKGGECPLQDISFGWGAGRSRFIEPKRHFKKPLELSPLIAIDRERCILCYRCVRFSQEIAEDYQLVFLERGDHTFVGTHDGRPYVAPFSGNILELCPVGALTSTSYRFRARPWDIEASGGLCTLCPSQCNVNFTVRDDKVVRVNCRDNHDVDDGWLCDKGRFAYQSIHARERITRPLVRDGGALREASWERALDEAAAALKKAGPDAAALVGGGTTNEEGFLVQHLVRKGLKSPHVDSRAGGFIHGEQARALARTDIAASVPDIEWAGAVLVIETELVDEAPILDLRVRKGARRHGTQVVTLSSRPSTLDPNAAAALRFAPGSAEAALGALASALGSPRAGLETAELAARAGLTPGFRPGHPVTGGEGPAAGSAERPVPSEDDRHSSGEVAGGDVAGALEAAAAVLRDASGVVVIWGERVAHGARGEQAVDALLAVAGALGLQGAAGSGMIEVPTTANGRGLREAGCLPNLGPGLKDASENGRGAGEIGRALGDGELSSLLLVGADPLRDYPERGVWEAAMDGASSVIAFADFRTDSLDEHATVVFPAESYAEKEGTLTHPDGRLQRVRQAIAHPGDTRAGWWVLSELCERVGAGLALTGAPAAFEQAAKTVPFWGGITYEELAGKGARWQERGASSSVPPAELPEGELEEPPTPGDGLRLGTVPSLWSGPETENAPALRFLAPRQRAELSAGDARRFGVSAGDEVDVSVDGQSVRAVAAVRASVPAGSIFLISGTAADNATALTNGVPRTVEVSRA